MTSGNSYTKITLLLPFGPTLPGFFTTHDRTCTVYIWLQNFQMSLRNQIFSHITGFTLILVLYTLYIFIIDNIEWIKDRGDLYIDKI